VKISLSVNRFQQGEKTVFSLDGELYRLKSFNFHARNNVAQLMLHHPTGTFVEKNPLHSLIH
jgi:hypothetical protein